MHTNAETKPDIFRIEYTPLTDEQKANVLEIKTQAQALYDLITRVGDVSADPRSFSIARTELEGAIMWAVKGATAFIPSAAPVAGDNA